MEGNRFILCTCRAHPSNSVEVLGVCRQSFHWLASGVGRWHRALFGSPGGGIGVQAQILLHPHGQVGHKVSLLSCDKIRFGRANLLQRVAPRSLGYWQYCPRYKKPDGLCVFPYLVQFFKSRLFSFLSDHYCPLCSGDCILVRHLVFTVERNSTSLDTFE